MKDFQIRPRKRSERGGYLTMPLVSNIQKGEDGWKAVKCPGCGTDCWQRPDDEDTIREYGMNGALCTICALKKGLRIK